MGMNIKYNPERKVQVYRNLHADLWSIRQDGLVVGREEKIILRDVTFHVQPAGNLKVRNEKRKNVHAYIKGYVSSVLELREKYKSEKFGDNECFEENPVTYNPYLYSSFVLQKDKSPIFKADYVDMDITDAFDKVIAINTKVVVCG